MPDEKSAELAALTRWRRDLHRIPELAFELPETTSYVRGVLDALSCEVWEPCRGALCAYLDLGRPEMVALRADMDALPVAEATGAPYASERPGRMHACGHDGHMAMALGAAAWVDRVMAGREPGSRAEDLPRNVLLVFQPAEETTGGARVVCESGVFGRMGVTRIFGFHLWPDLPAGALASRPEEKRAPFHYEPSCAIEEAEFVLREYNGCIGVFSPQSDAGPITVTDIETRSLREADREIVKNGIAVADREELLTLLEDFGS